MREIRDCLSKSDRCVRLEIGRQSPTGEIRALLSKSDQCVRLEIGRQSPTDVSGLNDAIARHFRGGIEKTMAKENSLHLRLLVIHHEQNELRNMYKNIQIRSHPKHSSLSNVIRSPPAFTAIHLRSFVVVGEYFE